MSRMDRWRDGGKGGRECDLRVARGEDMSSKAC